MFVLGAIVLLGVLAAAVFVVRNRPVPPSPDITPELVQRWPAVVLLMKFQQARGEGLERGIIFSDEMYNSKLTCYHAWWGYWQSWVSWARG